MVFMTFNEYMFHDSSSRKDMLWHGRHGGIGKAPLGEDTCDRDAAVLWLQSTRKIRSFSHQAHGIFWYLVLRRLIMQSYHITYRQYRTSQRPF